MNPRNLEQLAQRFQRQKYSPNDYLQGILAGNKTLLSQAITLVESQLPAHQQLAQELVELCLPHSGRSVRLGITGSPGVGKSTFIENFGLEIVAQQRKLAVLAIDPSSQVSGGSILGDKTRMQQLSVHPQVFVRPSPAGQSLGGVAQKTRETLILCEAAGFDTIIIETVGVGQSETMVQSMVDFFILLLLPNAGDELQGIKRGVMEMADLVVINKADSAPQAAQLARKQSANALHLFPAKPSLWTAQAVLASALQKQGLTEIWQLIQQFELQTSQSGFFGEHRQQQARYWLHQTIAQKLQAAFYSAMNAQIEQTEQQVQRSQLSPFYAADLLLNQFLNR